MKGLIGFCVFLLVWSCGRRTVSEEGTAANHDEVRYASKFRLTESGLEVTEPWPGAVRSISYPLGDPPKRVVVTSTTHLPYLEMLGVEDRLVGFPSTQYIYSPAIRKRVEVKKVLDLGPDGNMNLELLLSLQPDVVIAFDMGSESTTLDKIRESGIPVIYNADYLESSTLGRAEWIRFFGAIFNRQEKADSIFAVIESRYDSLKTLVGNPEQRPLIMSGVMYGDVWFLPGGNNWAARFFEDAGGTYLYGHDSTSGWLEVSFESVYERGRTADLWIGVSTFNSLQELAGQDSRYTAFAPFNTGNVYNYNKRLSPSGGYDFFESGYARPDRVLADLIRIVHPELLPEYETFYFQRLP